MDINKIKQLNCVQNNVHFSKRENCSQSNNDNLVSAETDLNNSSNVVYFKGILSQPYKILDILKLLEANGYKRVQNGYAKNITEQQEKLILFKLYPNAKEGYEQDVTFREFLEKAMSDEDLYKQFFKIAYTTSSVCKEVLSLSDISDLNEFSNLSNGEVGKCLTENFDYTLFIFKLMKHNDIYERFMAQVKEQPVLLDSLLQLLKNQPDVETIGFLNNYKTLSAFVINSSLNKLASDNSYEVDSETIENINAIDKYIDNFKIKRPLKVLRSDHPSIMLSLTNQDAKKLFDKLFQALGAKDDKLLDELCEKIKAQNFELKINGYLSTSLDYNMGRNILWNLTVQPDVKMLPLDLVNILTKETADENEFLVQRNTRLQIRDIKHNDNDQLVIDADVYPL